MSSRWMPLSGRAGLSRRRAARRSVRVGSETFLEVEWLEDRTLLSSSIPLSSVSWTPIGPAGINGTSGFGGGNGGPSAGRINGVVTDPVNPNVIYVAATGGGVWKTTDGGILWKPLTDGLPTTFMGSIAISKSSSNTIYAGSGQADNSGDSFYGRGVYQSTDGGNTWQVEGQAVFNRKAIVKIVISPTDPRTVFAAVATPAVNGVNGGNGVWKSTDGGATWANTTPAITTTEDYTDLVMDATNPLILYAAVGTAGGSASNGVYKTIDGGTTWAASASWNGAVNSRISLAIGVSDTKVLVASVANPATGKLKYLQRSTDGGASWSNLTSVLGYLGGPNNNDPGQGDYDNTVAIDPTDSKVIFAAGIIAYSINSNAIVESRDGGTSWFDATADSSGNQPHTDEHASGFDAAGHYLVAGDGGIWRLQDPNQSSLKWTDINGNLQITQFVGAALDPLNADVVLGGSQDNGSEIFRDNKRWKQIWGGDGGNVGIDQTNDQILYVTNPGIALLRSDDGGATFNQKTAGIGNDPSNFYNSFVIDPSAANHLLYGTNHLYTSTNRGDSWTALATPGTNGFTPSSPIDSIAIAASDPKTIYVATDTAQIFVSTDGGVNWNQRNVGGVSDSITKIAVDPADPKSAYATRGTFDGGGNVGHVFKTVDGGVNWTNISANLPDVPAFSLAIDARAGNQRIYVGNDQGVWASTDGGVNWAPFKTGMPNVQVTNLDLNTGLNILLASTYGRGMFEIIATDSINVIPAGLTTTEGTTLTNVQVATFTDSSATVQPASAYTASINWGDGTAPSLGTVTDLGSGVFGITGTHSYAEEGTFRETVSVVSVAGTSGQGETNINVLDAPLSGRPLSLAGTEGTKFAGIVASFVDGNTNAPLSDFKATIAWGDGSVSNGVVTAVGGGVFNVSGSNLYKTFGAYAVNVRINDVGASTILINSSANVADAPLTALPISFNAVVGAPFTNVAVASFSDAAPGGVASQYTVSIDWGDGSAPTTGAGVRLSFKGNRWDVLSGHTYQHYGTGRYPVTVTVTDDGGQTAVPVSTAVLTDATIGGFGQTFSTTEGALFSNLVATFSTANLFAAPADFLAPAIDWGDGSAPGFGTVVALSAGKFGVMVTHTYSEEGPVTVAVAVTSLGGSTAQVTSQGTVLDAPISVTALPQVGVAGQPLTPVDPQLVPGTVATFNDSYALSPLAEFSATINWGDGSAPTTGVILQPGGPGTTFSVTGDHPYAKPQLNYTIQVNVSEPGGSSATGTTTANVADAPFTVATQPLHSVVEGGVVSGAIGSFNTANTLAGPTDYIASIDWGDGTVTGGLITALGANDFLGGQDFNISSASPHVFTEEGSYPISIHVISIGGTPNQASTNVNVSDAPIAGLPAAPVSLVAGSTFSGVVGSFKENPNAPLSDFTATINWGDGSPTVPAVIGQTSNGSFTVSGSHLIPTPGTPQATINVKDVGGSSGKFTVGFNVSDVPIVAVPRPISAVTGSTFNGAVATFTQSNPAANAGQFTALITWGDGSSSKGVVTGANGNYTVTGAHFFGAPAAAQPITVSIAHVLNGTTFATASTSGTAHVLRGVSGGMSHSSDNGVANNDGVTTVRNPMIAGRAEPGTTISLYAAPSSSPASRTQVGSAVANASGNWVVQIGPLGDGSYVITASMFDPVTSLNVQSVRVGTGDFGGPLVIANSGPTVSSVALDPVHNQVHVVFQAGPAMMYYNGLVNPSNYMLAIPSGLSGLSALTPSKPVDYAFGPNGTIIATLTYAQKITTGSYVLTLQAAGLTDLAGNMLIEKRLVTFPQASNSPNPNYVAQIDVGGNFAGAPHQYVSLAEQQAAAQYSQYAKVKKIVRVPNIRAASLTFNPSRFVVPQGPTRRF